MIERVMQGARAAMEVTKVARRSQFELLPPPPGSVLFLGDSITEGGLWNEWFPYVVAINRGIGGDTVIGVADRLDTALGSPAVISLLIGTNDLQLYGQDRDVAEIVKEAEQLVRAVRQHAPKALAREVNAHYLDLWPDLADGAGALRAEFTLDALHLNGFGYRAWTNRLRPLIDDGIAAPDFAQR
jgi:lysophospholipase L1-like esterase